ncbi:acetyltransferase [Leifsonia sp. fls2-241-R2A-40a]|uniref:acetyltransferase n=1 Tax=Leifsonia sp. fls2-241-R2A-40a TaxID=3040290 RepID=UPI00254D2F10|nr:acetyltransferase [Leifsonia sp. fls2-241-R2A-40a]
MTAVVVVGAGGFGRETLDVLEAAEREQPGRFEVLGVVDDAPSETALERLAARDIAYLGTVDQWLGAGPDAAYLLGVGSPAVRERLDARLTAAGLTAATVVHPRAVIGSRVRIGDGSVVCGGVQLSTNVILGRSVHLNPGAIVGHDAVLEDFVSVNPGAIVSGEVRVGRGSLLGAGSVVLQGLRVGAGSTVGAAACVTRDVPDSVVVKGVPAR